MRYRHCLVALALLGCQTTCPLPSPPLDLSAFAAGPEGTAFYTPPSPLPAGPHGGVIWVRPLSGGAALPSAAHNVLVLYETASPRGAPVAVSGAIAIPEGAPPPGGWPVISWAHGTTGNAPQCAPSRTADANVEQRFLDAWVASGYAVLQTDYEGEGTPGIHPYFVGAAAARDLTDLVRAARAIDPQIGARWIVMGHSEGGHAALFTAAVGPTWAPELQLVGAIAIAPASHLTAALLGSIKLTRGSPFLPLVAMMVQGISVADPELHLEQVLSSAGLAMLGDLQRRCAGELVEDERWTSLPVASFFKTGADLRRLTEDFLANEPGALRLRVPVLLVQGEADDIVPLAATAALSGDLRERGAPVTYRTFPGEDHDSVMEASLRTAEGWTRDRFGSAAQRSVTGAGAAAAGSASSAGAFSFSSLR